MSDKKEPPKPNKAQGQFSDTARIISEKQRREKIGFGQDNENRLPNESKGSRGWGL